MPSNSQLVAIFVLFAIPLVFCFIGADYIFPKSKLFDYRTSFVKRADPTVTITPSYTIEKAWWTVGSRTGLVSFSLFPLTVLFALKAPPFAIFSVNFLVHTFFDTLTLMHKWSGRLIWLVTAIHVATWSVQLFKDGRNDGSGRSVWVVVWVYDKFIWGAISFFALSLLTVLSLQPVRKRFYEVSGGALYPFLLQGILFIAAERIYIDVLPHACHTCAHCSHLGSPSLPEVVLVAYRRGRHLGP